MFHSKIEFREKACVPFILAVKSPDAGKTLGSGEPPEGWLRIQYPPHRTCGARAFLGHAPGFSDSSVSRKNANCVRTCARVSQRTKKRMSYGGGEFTVVHNEAVKLGGAGICGAETSFGLIY